eukprot:CAMPEP_0113944784 /NCGR_PEP_ID=MMETSP1339-20121228/36789_1 /TAXON_ID=94617 /ORGANISM="Fibrocapsa japonica" /LENGTH=168 /DNA_ID=CAMNT_0000950103 /DNA_START=189 /DNA_END=693 /DNA_ORIENTATION=+ /assembly_acc=CAM_ASM_000762
MSSSTLLPFPLRVVVLGSAPKINFKPSGASSLPPSWALAWAAAPGPPLALVPMMVVARRPMASSSPANAASPPPPAGEKVVKDNAAGATALSAKEEKKRKQEGEDAEVLALAESGKDLRDIPGLKMKTKVLWKRYGVVAAGTWMGLYFVTLGGFYFSFANGILLPATW